MVNFIKTQNSFRHGELAKEFFSTGDVHAVSHLENMDIVANGALVRRPGLQRIYDLGATSGRLITFSVDEDEEYLIVLSNGIAKIFFHGEAFQTLVVPWSEEDIPLLQYTQKFGTMIFVHPDYSPRVLYKSGATLQLREFTFAYTPDQTNINMPFTRYEDTKDITITVTYPVDGVHMKTNKNFWTANHVGGCLSLLGKTWIINSYIGPKEITAVCTGTFTVPADPVSDWKEATFSATRGWPSCVTFHQDRLVFGGAKSWPGGVWMSKVGQHENFDLGTGLDDEAIFFTIVSDRRQQICTLISSNGLQILTSAGEWVVSNVPLTPSSVDIKMHTSIGSVADRYLPPQKIEGTTVFVANNKRDIRELVLDEFGEKYKSKSLCELANHLIDNPTDIAYNKNRKQLFVVMENGTMAVMNCNTVLEILGWARYTTAGKFKSVIVHSGETFVIVKRQEKHYLEKFSANELADSSGLSYQIKVIGLPLLSGGHNTRKNRIKKVTVRLLETKSLYINGIPAVFPNDIYTDDCAGFSGDVSVNLLGTNQDFIDAPWTISSNDSLPIKILGVTIYGRYQI